MSRYGSRILGIVLAMSLSGMLEPAAILAEAAPPAQQNQSQPEDQQGNSSPETTPAQNLTSQPTDQNRQQQEDKATQQMINAVPESGKELPESPDAIRAREKAAQEQQTQSPQRTKQPTGTAAAQEAEMAGSLASRPAGAAIAPAKQKRVRSFLIKLGAIAGAGAALGTVFALSRASGPKPPGAH